nr:hypothetical protein [uncultured Duganella sp.]
MNTCLRAYQAFIVAIQLPDQDVSRTDQTTSLISVTSNDKYNSQPVAYFEISLPAGNKNGHAFHRPAHKQWTVLLEPVQSDDGFAPQNTDAGGITRLRNTVWHSLFHFSMQVATNRVDNPHAP